MDNSDDRPIFYGIDINSNFTVSIERHESRILELTEKLSPINRRRSNYVTECNNKDLIYNNEGVTPLARNSISKKTEVEQLADDSLVTKRTQRENGMHDIMPREKFTYEGERLVAVSHKIYSLSDNNTPTYTFYGLSQGIYFGVPISFALVGYTLILIRNDLIVYGSLLHLLVGLWIFISYLLWVYGKIGFLFGSNAQTHSSTPGGVERLGIFGIYILVRRDSQRNREERRSASVHPLPSNSITSQNVPGSSKTHTTPNKYSFIPRAWVT